MNREINGSPESSLNFFNNDEQGGTVKAKHSNCDKNNPVFFDRLQELDFYPVNEPFAFIKILKDPETLDKYYQVIEPVFSDEEEKIRRFVQKKLIKLINVRVDEVEQDGIDDILINYIDQILLDYDFKVDSVLRKNLIYYMKRDFLGYGRIEALMRDSNIEDISCDGSTVPMFLFHREYGSLRSNIIFIDEDELSDFVVKLAQKCGKHISISEPMLDATMPDGSRIQMTLSTTVTTRGSTFTIRKFRSDPITATDLIEKNTMSSEMVAYMWLAVEHGVNALIAGGTAAGKTSTLNALCLFIPQESKIVSIEETREINIPHSNWIPGVSRSGFGEVIHDRMIGEIDLFDLMKAALRQRPEYILVGEIRGREAYVLFQAMATGHTTYSTVHADSAQSLIHRLEGKPIDIPRIMIASLDIVCIQINTQVRGKRVRRCKKIIEIIDIDPITEDILMNEVFSWDLNTDSFSYSGKSYILDRIQNQYDLNKEELVREVKQRVSVLNWLRKNNIREFEDVAKVVSKYKDKPNQLLDKIKNDNNFLDIFGEIEETLVKETNEKPVVYKHLKYDGKEIEKAVLKKQFKKKNRIFLKKKVKNRRNSHETF
jgi:flagellar protein FlaI